MASAINLVQGDTLPIISLILSDKDTGKPIDLSLPNTTVQMYFRAVGTTTILYTIHCSLYSDGSDGRVIFNFTTGQLSTLVGAFEGEVEINFNGQIQTVFDIIKFNIRAQFN